MNNKIISIGPLSDVVNKRFTGQTVLFDAFVNTCKDNNIPIGVINIQSNSNTPSKLVRIMEYIKLFLFLFCKLLFGMITLKPYSICYITTSLRNWGFYRDKGFVKMIKLFGLKVVAHQLGACSDHFEETIKSVGNNNFHNLLDSFDKLVVEGNYMKSQFDKFPDIMDKIKVLPNGLPLCGKHSLTPKIYDKESPFIVFYLSNLIFTKGWLDVLKAIDILVNQRNLNVKCVFSGRFMLSKDDPKPMIYNQDYFNHFINAHKLSEHIEYYQGLYGERKDQFFMSSHVFVLPSYYYNEGQPVSVLEAMSYGCVPIVTEYRHIPMMVNDANGCFVEHQSPVQIADVISNFIATPSEYSKKSEQCIKDFKEKFTFDRYFDELYMVLNNE